jgi:hypothetical protein
VAPLVHLLLRQRLPALPLLLRLLLAARLLP